jgi:hypothetical protein
LGAYLGVRTGRFLTDQQNEITDDEWDTGLEFWAREYLKGEGMLQLRN